MDGRSSFRRAFLDTALIATFLAVIAAPSVDRLVRPDTARGPEPERRTAAPRPEWSLAPRAVMTFPERFKAWFDDTFGLRDVLLRWNSIVKVFLLRTSPSRDLVLGKDGWWLYRGNGALDDWRGMRPFRIDELEAWRTTLEDNRERLRRRGIEYLFVVGPNKETIYPEKVPDRFDRVGPTRLDQLVEHLARHSDFRILDLRPALLAAKADDAPDDELYFRNGTHWNARGTMVAYQEIVANLAVRFPALQPILHSEFEEATAPDLDSWAPTMYIADLLAPSAKYWKLRGAPRSRNLAYTGTEGQGRRRVEVIDDPSLPSAVFVHDSFGQSLGPILRENFRRLADDWSNSADLTDVERERPDVFVQIYVERSLVVVSPEQYRIRGEGSEFEAYDRSSRTLFRFDPGSETSRLEPTQGMVLGDGGGTAENGLEMKVRVERPRLRLPSLEFPRDVDLLVALDISVPSATIVCLYDEVDDERGAHSTRKAGAKADAGRNRIYLRVDPRTLHGRLGILPGGVPGTYRLHQLEIRAVERAEPAIVPAK